MADFDDWQWFFTAFRNNLKRGDRRAARFLASERPRMKTELEMNRSGAPADGTLSYGDPTSFRQYLL